MSDASTCSSCSGHGSFTEHEFERCYSYGGSGSVFDFDRNKTCGSCGGFGGRQVAKERSCIYCYGTGYRDTM